MSIKHNQLEISADKPFENCKLGREKYADILSALVDNYANGFVLAVNNEWGTGKTTFVKMWEKKLKNSNHKTLYFNAWEHDFENNALVALMAKLKELAIDKKTEKIIKKVIAAGSVLAKSAFPIIFKALAEKYIGKETIKEMLSGVGESITEIFTEQINDYANKQNGLEEFKENLRQFVKATSLDKPLIFFIDELDRCRPDYAIEVLEKVKHFFSVPNIVFVLSIDKNQLGNAVRGFYGSDKINAEEYLRRFIDVEYSIPQPDLKRFSTYLFEYFNFAEFFSHELRSKHSELRNDEESFIKTSEMLAIRFNLSLRQLEKIYAQARISLKTFSLNNYLFPSVFICLICLKMFDNGFYTLIKNRQLSIEEFIMQLNEKIDFIDGMEPLFVYLYFNYINKENDEKIADFKNNYYPVRLGKVNKDLIGQPSGSTNLIWEQLIKDGLIREDGVVLNKIRNISSESQMSFDLNLNLEQKEQIIKVLVYCYLETEKIRKYISHLFAQHDYLKLSYLINKVDLVDDFIVYD